MKKRRSTEHRKNLGEIGRATKGEIRGGTLEARSRRRGSKQRRGGCHRWLEKVAEERENPWTMRNLTFTKQDASCTSKWEWRNWGLVTEKEVRSTFFKKGKMEILRNELLFFLSKTECCSLALTPRKGGRGRGREGRCCVTMRFVSLTRGNMWDPQFVFKKCWKRNWPRKTRGKLLRVVLLNEYL